jgi:hypothetical protein
LSSGPIREWLFRALSAEDAVDRLEQEGLAIRASRDPRAMQRVLPIDEFSPPIRKAAMAALPAYLAFFCLENAIRELINERLGEVHGSDWWETRAPKSVRDRVQSRKEKEGANRWHVSRGEHPVYYTDFGDLRTLVQNNWENFEDLFPDQNWVLTRMAELEASRNIIAHSNTLDDRELDRIRLYLQDWLRQVG